MSQHGPNFLEPPPDIMKGEPEWEVEKIIKEHTHGWWKKKQYLIRWKGYSPAYNKWVLAKDLHAPELLAEFQNQSNSIRTLSLDESHSPPPTITLNQNNSISESIKSLCPFPMHSLPIAPTFPTQSLSPWGQLTEQSSLGSIPPTTTSISLPPLSIEKTLTYSSYGQMFDPILEVLTLTTKQSPSPMTAPKPSPTSSRLQITFQDI
jgi:hypothetical protein